nr:PQQ-dependent sugar dehydrogenase [Clostridium guangxiense]
MSILCYKGKLYVAKGHGIYCYDFQSKTLKELVTNIPNFGDYKKVIIKVYKDYIYASIGSATNSGIVGNDNKWTSINPYGFDITPNSITLRGINFGKDKTGAFVPYKTSNIRGQIIPNHFPGNSSVIIININTKAAETYAWGIRNICGMDFTSGGKIIASVGGMENRGLRPIKGDVDYIYSIEKGKWYGWPDYSGGDPVDSPKFKNRTKRILDKVPNINPPAPLYEYDKLGSLGAVNVDSSGVLGLKDLIYAYDKKDSNIICINGNKMNKYIMFTNKSYVENFRIYKDGIYVLDSKEGCLLQFYKYHENALLIVDKKILYCIVAAIGISALVILIYGMKKN